MTVIYHGKTGFKILFFRFLMNLLNTNQNFCNFANKLNTPFMAKNSPSDWKICNLKYILREFTKVIWVWNIDFFRKWRNDDDIENPLVPPLPIGKYKQVLRIPATFRKDSAPIYSKMTFRLDVGFAILDISSAEIYLSI